MAWDLGSWMVTVRSLQLFGTLVCAALNGFLLVNLTINRLGPSQALMSLEWIVCPPLPPSRRPAAPLTLTLTPRRPSYLDMLGALLHCPQPPRPAHP